jgi:hypothetical protein
LPSMVDANCSPVMSTVAMLPRYATAPSKSPLFATRQIGKKARRRQLGPRERLGACG